MSQSTKGDLLAELARMRSDLEPLNRDLATRITEIQALTEKLAPDVRMPTYVPIAKGDGRMQAKGVPIPFVMKSLAPNAVIMIQARPQILFRGEYLWIDAACASHFDLLDLMVGKGSERADCSFDYPATAFALDFAKLTIADIEKGMTMRRWQLDTAEPGLLLTLVVHNHSNKPRDFAAVVWGVGMF